jgi:4-alpha-glucanotransferase
LYGHFNPALPLSVKEIEAYGLNFRGAVKQLFVSDPYNPHRRHPYISPQKMSAYSKLNESEQAAFARLRHDYFFVRHNEFWKQTALKRLKPLIESTKMLICGEDLGMMPASVHEVMDELQIFTLELGRLSKQYGVEFTDLNAIPERSVCTTSTHDMEPLREWWKEDPVRAHRYCAEMFHGESVFMPECEPETAKQIVTRHVKASSMLTVIPVQDWLATTRYTKTVHPEEERINVPSNPNNHWCYRMQDQIELLLTYCDLTEYIRSICAR